MKKHIFLTGFMGSGKSSVAACLAGMLKRPCLDMDRELERQFKMPVKEIFTQHGEAAFRRAESRLLRKIASLANPQVVACGGGSVVLPENRALMDDSGSRVFLHTPLPEIKRRLAEADKGQRPLWRDGAEQLFAQRAGVYASAGIVVDGCALVPDIARQLAAMLFTPAHAVIKAMGVECALHTVWPDAIPAVKVSGRKSLLLLDAALKEQAGPWQEAGFNVRVMKRRGEALKTFAQAQKIMQLMLTASLARDDYLVVRGGGSLSDMGAFCAGLYKRGLKLVLVPTTLLGAVDAAIGGKTALNFNGAKNQVGHFYLPQKVVIDVAAFASLKPAQLADGLVEAYKTALIADRQLAAFIEDNLAVLKRGDLPYLAQVAGRAMQIKAALVQKDFREQLGIRDVLNLGHTFGHAVESWCNYKVSHGRAVAAGLLTAIRLSQHKAGLQPGEAERIIYNIKRICKIPQLPPRDSIAAIISQDKKYRCGRMGFILLQSVGRPVLTHDLVIDDVLRATYGDSVA